MNDADAASADRPQPAQHALARYGVPLLLLGIAFAFQVASLSRAINIYDEALILFGAQRILEGAVPYRDFWGMYAPGQFYAVAALFKLFGSSVLAERLWDVAIRAAIATMTYLWARKLGAGRYSYAAWLVTLLMLAGRGFHGFPIFPALLFALISGYLMLGALGALRPAPRLWAAGAFAGLTALFRHDMGFYLVLAEATAIALSLRGLPGEIARASRMLLALGCGALLVAAPAAVFLLVKVPLGDLWFNLFLAPATIYPKVRALPLPELPNPIALLTGAMPLQAFWAGFVVYFPLVIGPAALIYLAMARRHGAATPQERLRRLGILLLALIALLMFLKGIVRISPLHMLQSTVPTIILSFVLLARAGRDSRMRQASAVAVGVAVAVALAIVPARIAIATAAENVSVMRPLMPEAPRGLRGALVQLCAPRPGLERARCFLPRGDDAAVVQSIRSRTQPGEPIYVGVTGHDRIFVNNILIYYLADRPSATKWHESHPGIQTSAPIQTQMIAEFDARKARYLVLSAEWDTVNEPNASALSSGVRLLDDYIRANFDPVERFGAASVWRRR